MRNYMSEAAPLKAARYLPQALRHDCRESHAFPRILGAQTWDDSGAAGSTGLAVAAALSANEHLPPPSHGAQSRDGREAPASLAATRAVCRPRCSSTAGISKARKTAPRCSMVL